MAEGGYSAGSIFLQVVPSFAGFEAAARKAARGMEDIFGDSADRASDRAKNAMRDAFESPDVENSAKRSGKKAGDAMGGSFQDSFDKYVTQAMKRLGNSADAEVQRMRKTLEGLRNQRIGIDVDAETAVRQIRDVEAAAHRLAALSPHLDIQSNAVKVAAELNALQKEIGVIDGRNVKIKIDVDDKATRKLSTFDRLIGRTGSQAEDTANSFRAFNGVLLTTATIGPALIPILAAIAGGLLALGPAAAAAVAGLGGLAIAFSGIGNAIGALNDAQKNAVKDQEAGAKRIRNATETVANAQRRMSRAVQDAAEANEDAARRRARAERDAAQANEDAAQRVANAQRNAADAVERALERRQDAEESLADAQRDATRAQEDLREARAQAQKDLDDVAARQRQNAVDERQAVIDLFNATVQYNAVMQDSGSTNLEREQASINLEQSRIRLEGIRKEEKELQEQRVKGVQGSERVQTAEERVQTAIEQQKDAQEQLQRATEDVTEARVDGARAIKEAVEDQQRTEREGAESVADAIREQQRASADGQRSIADASIALKQAQADLRDAIFETSVIGSASAQRLKDAMDALGPSGRAFALFIFGLKDEFYAIRDAVQAGLFPGLMEAIQTLVDVYLPDFTAFMGEIGKVFGDIAVLTANTLTNDTWKQFFSIFRTFSPKLIENYSKVFLNLATVVAQLLTLTAPFALEFSQVLVGLSQELVAFFASAEGQQMWLDFLDTVKQLGPPVMDFFRALGPAIVALAEALIPLGTLVLEGLTGILEWIAALDPKTLQGIVIAILTMVAAFQLAVGIIVPLAGAAAVLGTTMSAVVAIVVAVIGVLIYLYTTSDTAKRIITTVLQAIGDFTVWYIKNITIPVFQFVLKVFREVAEGVAWAWENILKPALDALWTLAQWLWENILSPVFTGFGNIVSEVFGAISWAWTNVLGPVFDVIAKIVWELWELAFKVALDNIKAAWDGLGAALSAAWTKVIFPVIKAVAGAMGIDIENGTELKNGLVAAFRSAIEMIGQAWGRLKELAKGPVDFLVRTVINDGLVGGFNWLASKLGMDPVDPIPWPPKGFAKGGIPYGIRPGYTPGRDTHLIAVGGGEAILRPELTRALGADWVHGANYAARTGGVRGAARFLGGFKNGGLIDERGGSGVGIYDVTNWRGKKFNYYTIRMIQAAEALLGQTLRITQGSFSTSVAASGSTHAGGGALDASVRNLPGLLRQTAVLALRQVGFAAWLRNPSQGPWPYHIHAIAAGDPTASPSAQRQVRDYYNGGDGLGGRDDGPNVKKDPNLLKRILGAGGDLLGDLKDVIASPLEWIKGKIEGPLKQMTEKFGESWLTKGLAKIPERFFGAIVDRIKGLLPGGEGSEWTGTLSELQNAVRMMAQSQFGWAGSQWSALNWLVQHESSWNPNAQNPTSTAYGLFQFLDGTWGPYGKKTSDPMKQAQYGMQYIKDRYGSPEKAKAFWESHHWYADGGIVGENGPATSLPDNGTMMYDNGGYLPPGLTTVLNLTGKPEPVFTAEQFEGMRGGSGGGFTYSPTFNASDLTADDVMDDFRFEMRRLRRGS